MRILITAGPAYEPIDRVRRLTNFSTGELGTRLAESFARAGHSVLLCRGTSSTYPTPATPVELAPYGTNAELETVLRQVAGSGGVHAIFHAAALADFRLRERRDAAGKVIDRDKISSREEQLQLILEPAPKLIAGLRRLFPAALLVGWKYELEGHLDEVLRRGRAQMDEHLTDACVLNGTAYGPGFGLISRAGDRLHFTDKPELCRFLVEWLERTPLGDGPPRPESFHALASFVRPGAFSLG